MPPHQIAPNLRTSESVPVGSAAAAPRDLERGDAMTAIGFVLNIPGGTCEQYLSILQTLGIELHGKPVAGQVLHAAGPYEGGWRVVDVWESRAAFDRFFHEQLVGVIEQVGGPQPEPPQFFEVYNIEK